MKLLMGIALVFGLASTHLAKASPIYFSLDTGFTEGLKNNRDGYKTMPKESSWSGRIGLDFKRLDLSVCRNEYYTDRPGSGNSGLIPNPLTIKTYTFDIIFNLPIDDKLRFKVGGGYGVADMGDEVHINTYHTKWTDGRDVQALSQGNVGEIIAGFEYKLYKHLSLTLLGTYQTFTSLRTITSQINEGAKWENTSVSRYENLNFENVSVGVGLKVKL